MSTPRPTVHRAERPSTRYRPGPAPAPDRHETTSRPVDPASTPGVFDAHEAPSVRPGRRARPRRQRHLVTFAVAIPASGAAGLLAGAIDAFSAVAAAVLPVAVFLGIMAARLLLFRALRWVWSVITAVTGRLR